MDFNNIVVIGFLSGFLFIFLVCFLIVIYFLYKTNQKINEMNSDVSDALTKMITYLNSEFKSNSQAHQDTIDWYFKNLEKLTEFNSQNFNLIFSQNNNTSASLNVIMELLGYRPKFDESQIERPKVNYAEPPAPKKIEGLRINDKDK